MRGVDRELIEFKVKQPRENSAKRKLDSFDIIQSSIDFLFRYFNIQSMWILIYLTTINF